MRLVHEDPALRVQYLAGSTPSLVVAFSGIGHGFGGMQTEEFVGTASDGGRNHVLFVADRKRSWYSGEGLMERLVDRVANMAAEIGVVDCKTIGNSMGGYGAVRLSRDFPVSVVASFSPQFSMDRRLINEHRWEEHRPAIVLERHLPLAECLVTGTRYYLVFGGASKIERDHRDLFPAHPGLHCLTLPGAGHNIVQKIKEYGLLQEVVQAMFAKDEARIARFETAYAAGVAAEQAEAAKS